MPLSAVHEYSAPKVNTTIKLKCLAIQQCIEFLGSSKDASKCYRYYNVTILEVVHITDKREIKKQFAESKSAHMYKVKISIQSTGQPRGLYKKLFGQEFSDIYLGEFNYGRDASRNYIDEVNHVKIWYKVNHEGADKLRANQAKYAEKHKKRKRD
jgi:hypothetical protein